MDALMTPFAVAWLALALAVVALAAARKVVSYHEDDLLHVREGDAAINRRQADTAHKLDVIDRWGKVLTAAAVGSGIVLAAWIVYRAWIENNKLPGLG